MRTCSVCKESLPLEMFNKDSVNGIDGKARRCRTCKNAYERAYYRDRGRFNPRTRNRKKAYNNPERARGYKLKSIYGITQEEFDQMKADQNNLCAICSASMGLRRPVIDHNHDTGRNRGLLCQQCNALLGMAGDSVEVLRAAVEYLERDRIISAGDYIATLVQRAKEYGIRRDMSGRGQV